MSKTVQIRNLDDDVYRELARQAADEGISVPELLRRAATRLASRHGMSKWLRHVAQQPLAINGIDVVGALDEIRGPWPLEGAADGIDRRR